MIRSFALYGGQFLLPLFLLRQQGYSEDRVGLMMLPGALVIALLFPFSGRGSDRHGAKPFVLTGLLILIAFFSSMATLSMDTGYWGVQIPMIVRGIGLGLLITPLTSLALGSISSHHSANGSILMNLAQQLGGSLGIATLGSVLEVQSRAYGRTGLAVAESAVLSYQDAFRIGAFVCVGAFLLALALPKPIQGSGHGTA